MPPFDQTVNMTLTASEERRDSGQTLEEGAGYAMSMPDVTYERFVLSPKLALYVEHFWMVSAPAEPTPEVQWIRKGGCLLFWRRKTPGKKHGCETVPFSATCCDNTLRSPPRS